MHTQGRDTIYKMTDLKSWRQSKLVCLQFGLSENLTISYFNSRKFIISYKIYSGGGLFQHRVQQCVHNMTTAALSIILWTLMSKVKEAYVLFPCLHFRGREHFLLSFPTPPHTQRKSPKPLYLSGLWCIKFSYLNILLPLSWVYWDWFSSVINIYYLGLKDSMKGMVSQFMNKLRVLLARKK